MDPRSRSIHNPTNPTPTQPNLHGPHPACQGPLVWYAELPSRSPLDHGPSPCRTGISLTSDALSRCPRRPLWPCCRRRLAWPGLAYGQTHYRRIAKRNSADIMLLAHAPTHHPSGLSSDLCLSQGGPDSSSRPSLPSGGTPPYSRSLISRASAWQPCVFPRRACCASPGTPRPVTAIHLSVETPSTLLFRALPRAIRNRKV